MSIIFYKRKISSTATGILQLCAGMLIIPILDVFAKLLGGRLDPVELEVVAGQRFKIELHNAGSTPVEFESRRLRQEKVMGPGVHSFVVVHPLKPGRYDYFDEFHLPDAQGVIIAREASEEAHP